MLNQVNEPVASNHIIIYRSELDYMAQNSASWGNRETGGELYGNFSHGGRPIVCLSTGPGPKAVHDVTHFAQDPDFFTRLNRILSNDHGLQFIGDWHSHHDLGIDHPSSGDVEHIHSIATRNNYGTMAEILFTFNSEDNPRTKVVGKGRAVERVHNYESTPGATARSGDRALSVRAHAFLYKNASENTYERCPIRVLTFQSPFRSAAIDAAISGVLGPHSRSISLSCNEFRFSDPVVTEPCYPLDRRLWQQCQRLPDEALDTLTVAIEGNLVILTIRLPLGSQLVAVYENSPPFEPKAARLSAPGGDRATNILSHVLLNGCTDTVQVLYYAAARIERRNRSDQRTTYAGAGGPWRSGLRGVKSSFSWLISGIFDTGNRDTRED